MSNPNHGYDEEDEEDLMPFEGIDKAAVLQQCRDFSAVNINVEACIEHMTKILYLLSTGTTFTPIEATDIFFGSTKLFQTDDQKLRRLLFVFLKELSGIAEQVFIASSSLVKDISSNNDVNRCNAIRTLRKVTDVTMIGPMERYLKQAVVDKQNSVVSAAIVTGIHLAYAQPEMVKRWGTEVNEALKNRGSKVQYHALALLHKLRKNDRVSVLKLVQQAQTGPMDWPHPQRTGTLPSHQDVHGVDARRLWPSLDLYKFVTNMTHHSSDSVVFEAAKAICSLKNITAKEVSPAVLVIGLYLTSHKPVLRFAAIRLLNRVATVHPSAVATLNADIESLVSDPNRNVATLAITTLLKTGTEFSIDRLVKQLTGNLGDLSDEFKIVIVDSMRVLNAKFPAKYSILVEFLSSALTPSEGGGEFKKAVVETMVAISQSNPAAKEAVLVRLAEFIEDCEYPFLIKQVLTLIGEEGPTTSNPKRFVRYIYNHVQLESPVVRAVAVSTLAKFAAQVPALRTSIATLFQRTMNDPDDEVRDRAVFFYKLFTLGDEIAIRTLVTEVSSAVIRSRGAAPKRAAAMSGAEDTEAAVAAVAAATGAAASPSTGSASSSDLSIAVLAGRDKLRRIAQFKEFGEPSRTLDPLPLTEADNEYVVSVLKHQFAEHVVFQFKVTNTMDNISLENINIDADLSELEVEPLFAVPISRVEPGSTEYGYIAARYEAGQFPSGAVKCAFRFRMKEGDDEPSEEEEYPIEEFAVNVSDFILPLDLGNGFESQWTAFREEETMDTYALTSMRNLTVAAQELIDFYGMWVEGGKVEKITTKSHVVNMCGVLPDAKKTVILISGKVFVAADNSVALQLAIRGGNAEVRAFLSAALVS
ncbi:coatamer gamma subunit, putative [Bodo saltans]|uniref:Coatomer subunit gamma n=1 Tax=Bodo saltans TaxID=75058 RepID=A0A0S4IV67_BODSA|nr:coatamer gamma subunit, putative [Bodo saltans]|eukprot:CUF48450.1 coatamer gamma subunit, putative [Bodo saltans]